MSDEGWVRDKLFAHAAELGAQQARQEATTAEIARIASAMEKGFVEQRELISQSMKSVESNIMRDNAHVRGEIARLDDLYKQQRKVDEQEAEQRRAMEKRETDKVMASLRETAERSEAAANKVKQLNRRIIFAVVFVGACASAFLENAPALFTFIGSVLNGLN